MTRSILSRVCKLSVAVVLACLGVASAQDAAPNAVPNAPPNIVLINLDDADAELLSPRMLDTYYPNIKALADGGIRFTNVHVTTPFCGPSRASLMTGQYGYNSGVKVNDPAARLSNGFSGGYEELLNRDHIDNELGVWMKEAGYRTMHVGKYHHHNFNFQIPPGWDDFRLTTGARYVETFRFSNEFSQRGTGYRTGSDEYITDLEAEDARRLLVEHASRRPNQPFFLYVAPIAPHRPAGGDLSQMVPPRYPRFASGESLNRNDPDWNEEDVSDKPIHLQLPQPSQAKIESLEEEHLARIRAIKAVDDEVGLITRTLIETGAYDNCYIILTSDNGYQLGHHRMLNKSDPFERTTTAATFVSGPGIDAGQTADHLLAHIDLCPTIAELAGARVPAAVDAKSFVPLLMDPTSVAAPDWQESIMIENWTQKTVSGNVIQGAYTALRFYDSIYISWANGAEEFYDLAKDPFQIENQHGALPKAAVDQLRGQMSVFRNSGRLPELTILDEPEDDVDNGFVFFDGFIEDNVGVEKVGVTVQSFFTNEYYDGQSWGAEWTQMFVEPDARGALISQWQFQEFIPPPQGVEFDFYLLSARPFDVEGNYASEFATDVRAVDMSAPKAIFSDQFRSNPIDASVRLAGTFEENFEMGSVRISILNADTDLYWDGQQWLPGWRFIDADFEPEGSWRLDQNLPPGRVYLSVRAIDRAGNVQEKPDVIFTVVR